MTKTQLSENCTFWQCQFFFTVGSHYVLLEQKYKIINCIRIISLRITIIAIISTRSGIVVVVIIIIIIIINVVSSMKINPIVKI